MFIKIYSKRPYQIDLKSSRIVRFHPSCSIMWDRSMEVKKSSKKHRTYRCTHHWVAISMHFVLSDSDHPVRICVFDLERQIDTYCMGGFLKFNLIRALLEHIYRLIYHNPLGNDYKLVIRQAYTFLKRNLYEPIHFSR